MPGGYLQYMAQCQSRDRRQQRRCKGHLWARRLQWTLIPGCHQRCGHELDFQGEQCYPVEVQEAIFTSDQLRALERTANIPQRGSVRETCPPPAPRPPPPPPAPLWPPGSECITRSLLPGTNSAGGGTNRDSRSPECINLPRISGIRSITMWFQPLSRQDSYRWDYILDARGGLRSGWISFVNRRLYKGRDWRRLGWYEMSPSGMRPSRSMPWGRWYHFYAEAGRTFTDDIKVLCRFTNKEDLHANLGSVSLWNRPLSNSEIRLLSRGASGPQFTRSLLATYTADDASITRIRDGTCRRPDATITNGVSTTTFAPLPTNAGLPSCIRNLGSCVSSPPPPQPSPPPPAPPSPPPPAPPLLSCNGANAAALVANTYYHPVDINNAEP